MPRSPGHVFRDRLQAELVAAGFDGFVEGQCAPCYAARRGRPSLPPGRLFRMLLVDYFEGIGSERGLEWRCADSLSLREYLRLGEREPVPDHSWLSWSLDLVADALGDGRRFRVLAVVDGFTRERLAPVADTPFPGARVVRESDALVAVRGRHSSHLWPLPLRGR